MQEEVSSSDEQFRLSQECFETYFSSSLNNITVDDLFKDLTEEELLQNQSEPEIPTSTMAIDESLVASGGGDVTFPSFEISQVNNGVTFPPSQISFIGEHEFDIYFEPPKGKNSTWIYKKDRDKLYVTKDLAVPINFFGRNTIPQGSKIRTIAVYSQVQFMNDIVKRCTNHLMKDYTEGKIAFEHLIQCQAKQAVYEQVNGIYSVTVPYEIPQRGQSYSAYIYRFMCFGSCPGGPNRRPIKIIFMLEYQNVIIGQRCLELKICASPQRDSKNEDNRQNATTSGSSSKKKRPIAHTSDEIPVEIIPVFKQEQVEYMELPGSAIPTDISTIDFIPDASLHSSCLLASNNWPGDYGFDIKLAESGKSFTYNPKFDKLYISKDVPCAITFTCKATVGTDVLVRVMPMFSLPEHAEDVVQRCPYHTQKDINAGVLNANHLIHCEYQDAEYHVDQVTGRQSVVVPFHNRFRHDYSTFIFRFCCLCSCPGGLNRRPLNVVFTLEHRNIVYGRRSLDVKICASPQRDLKNDERLLNASKPPESTEPPPKKKKQDPEALKNLFMTFNVMDTSNLDPEQPKKTSYTITVNDPKEYAFLRGVQKRYHEQKEHSDESTTDESD